MLPFTRAFSLLTKAPPKVNRAVVGFPRGDPWTNFDRFFESWPFMEGGERHAAWPKVDIVEKPEAWEMHVDVPGMKESDIDIKVQNGAVEISGKRTHEIREEDQEKNLRRVERTFGSFKRTFSLPETVDEAKIKARLDQGVLELTLPKSKVDKPESRSIPINTPSEAN